MEAVRLQDTRKRATVSLPSAPGSEIRVVLEFNMGQQRRIANAGTDPIDRGIATLVEAVESWNLTDEAGEPLKIEAATFERFMEADLMALFCAVTGKTEDELKQAGEAVKKNQPLSFSESSKG